jgi:hypothetical protein
MVEYISNIELTNEYWDCECEKNFIHSRLEDSCAICQAERENQPDSRVNEVLSHGLSLAKLHTE